MLRVVSAVLIGNGLLSAAALSHAADYEWTWSGSDSDFLSYISSPSEENLNLSDLVIEAPKDVQGDDIAGIRLEEGSQTAARFSNISIRIDSAEFEGYYGLLWRLAAGVSAHGINTVISRSFIGDSAQSVDVWSDSPVVDSSTLALEGVTIDAGAFVYGVNIWSTDGGATATNNTLIVRPYTDADGTVVDTTTGDGVLLAGAWTQTLELSEDQVLTGNTVVIEDTTVKGTVMAAVAHDPLEGQGVRVVTGNRVALQNAVVEGAVYGGGTAVFDGQGDTFAPIDAGNTISASGHSSAGELHGFDTLELAAGSANAEQAVLTITGASAQTFSDKTIRVIPAEGYRDDASYKLLDVADGAGAVTFTNSTLEKKTLFTDASWRIDEITLSQGEDLGSVLTRKPDERSVTANSKTLSESLLGTVAFVNQGAEFVADELMHAMRGAVANGKAAFGAMQGGTSNYQTGSRVDVDGFSLAAGTGVKAGDFILAGFIEAGWASSESHVGAAEADGDHDYYGAGLLARWEPGERFYVDGSLRLGWASTEFDGRYASGRATYDSDAFYGSAHVAAGSIFELCSRASLDLYGRYTFTYLSSDDVTLTDAAQTKLSMDSTVTHAFRIGARVFGDISENADWRFGLAYEHVADGDAESSVNGLALDVPTLEGDTGIAEVNISIRPSASSPWFLTLGLKGYAGDREGASGSVLAGFVF